MALHTPRHRGTGLQRPSYGNLNGSSPSALSASNSKGINRAASLQALTGGRSTTPGSNSKMEELEVGDMVSVPGHMFGTVKFVGSVRGKNGRFVGVELDEAFATKGKNDGDVDGTQYFSTSIPGAGIFLPVHRAEKRTVSLDSFPATPSSPSLRASIRAPATGKTPRQINKFSQSVGPGARPSSPNFKPRRPSLPRPESPLRKQPDLRPTPARPLSQSVRGGRPSGLSATTPSKTNMRSSTAARPGPTPRPYSRTGSRAGQRDSLEDDDKATIGFAKSTNGRNGSTSSVPSFSQPLRSPSRLGSAGADVEVQRLKHQLQERDKRLDEQAASLTEMERAVAELSAIIPTDGITPGEMSYRGSAVEDQGQTAVQLRRMLREKNEKISIMTAEFDQHRADFRSTLDSLEMASTETERVYEEQKKDLLQQVQELQEYHDGRQRDEVDVESVANQLKQLEELVAELEEGLEESRRGEAEARGEVEFLRGEVERGRSELKREREKAAAALKVVNSPAASSPKIIEEKEDEIRGLKAIIHSLSSTPPGEQDTSPKGAYVTDKDELDRLRASLEISQQDKERLEEKIEQMRRDLASGAGLNGLANGGHIRNDSERTVGRPDTPPLPPPEKSLPLMPRTKPAGQANGTSATNGTVSSEETYCEMCESSDHDTLECSNLKRHHSRTPEPASEPSAEAESQPRSVRNAKASSEDLRGAASKDDSNAAAQQDEDKWCALCEKDGHLAFDCPEEQY